MNKPSLEPFDPSLPHSAKERWVCIYPCYINNRRTRDRGRKLPLDQCVENPKHNDVTPILEKLPLKYLLETKVHPRELESYEPLVRWRIRVQLKNDDGTPVDERYPTRYSLLEYLGRTIPILRSRRGPASSGTSEGEQLKKGKKKKKR